MFIIDTILNFGGHDDFTCEQSFTVAFVTSTSEVTSQTSGRQSEVSLYSYLISTWFRFTSIDVYTMLKNVFFIKFNFYYLFKKNLLLFLLFNDSNILVENCLVSLFLDVKLSFYV